ncbi:pyocin knob domain-containing protein [Pseudomonas aeruginosa]|uniref:pyocin knob domain-containing protein n=1 Tax=Pseudomonas aeruginosa TaxID=287 RepID=UPI0018C84A45|nr:phage tail protein [Pseudomonas aeruginosa]EKV6516224.1 phage tail protein [Pseudomonas aeruginosa]MBG4155485.1 phage tail protein [Pseudomonas aeruginosa]MBG4165331.1 phage tail protein [Pseudomonas aeruginosa]MBG4485440.1 phage tail protein [Pseudomonas aeruginosa]MBG4498568.1 phage tail protein [Pseudomonas aeruginosa]
MATLPESPEYASGIYQIETSDPVVGGPGGVSNKQGEQLACRTAWLKVQVDGLVTGSIVAGKAARLSAVRTLSITGAGTGSAAFDGSANAAIALTLANSGVSAGTYSKVTVNAKGLVTAGAALVASDIPALDWSKITTGRPTTLGGYGITDALAKSDAVTSPTPNKLLLMNSAGQLPASITGNAATASKWAIARTLSISGDATGSGTLDGSANASITVTLANTGVADGTYTKVRVNPKGLVIGATTLTTDDIPSLDASKITSGMFADARLPWYAQGLCTSAPNTTDPNTTNIPLILTNHENGPIPGQYFYIQTMMYNQRNGNAGQIAVRYAANAEMYVRYMYDVGNKRGVWSAWKRCDVGGSFAKEPDSRIGDAFDLNTLESSGWWYQTANGYAASGANYPIAKAGRLMVYRASSDFIYQTYQTHDGFMFHRCRYAGTWQPWREQWSTVNFNPANYVAKSEYSWASLPGKPATFPPSGHNHDASQITSGVLPLARGGLGNGAGQAQTALKLATARTISITGAGTASVSFDGSGNVSLPLVVNASDIQTGILPLARGGTGANNAATARSNIGAGTIATASLGTSGWWQDNDTGLIRQWGVTASIGMDSSATITFPRAFPRNVFGANWKQRAPGDQASSGNQVITNLTTTNMTIYQGDNTAGPVYWEAWGY